MIAKTQYGVRETRMLFESDNEQGSVAASGRPMLDRLAGAVRRIRRRARLRRDLERLDERLLHDIGAQQADLEAEAAKPFWRR